MSSHEDKSKKTEELLESRIEDYRVYFKSSEDKQEKLDHQGTTAYINLVKLVMSIREACGAEKPQDDEQLTKLTVRILKEVYGIER